MVDTSWYSLDEDFNVVPTNRARATGMRNLVRNEVLGMLVSTTFLGLDHRYGRDGLPLVFETMVFDGPWDQELQWRETSFARAMARHRTTMRLLVHAVAALEKTPAQESLMRLGAQGYQWPTPMELVGWRRYAAG